MSDSRPTAGFKCAHHMYSTTGPLVHWLVVDQADVQRNKDAQCHVKSIGSRGRNRLPNVPLANMQ
jgi:hypothetical protein